MYFVMLVALLIHSFLLPACSDVSATSNGLHSPKTPALSRNESQASANTTSSGSPPLFVDSTPPSAKRSPVTAATGKASKAFLTQLKLLSDEDRRVIYWIMEQPPRHNDSSF